MFVPRRWFSSGPARPSQPTSHAKVLTSGGKTYIVNVGNVLPTSTSRWQCDEGFTTMGAIKSATFGDAVPLSTGKHLLVLPPTLEDILARSKRRTQVVHSKDAAILVHKMSVVPGSVVVEAGSGSGNMTTALAFRAAPTGKVFSFEERPEHMELAAENIARLGLDPYVSFRQGDVCNEESVPDLLQDVPKADAVFIDLREPPKALKFVLSAIKPGGIFACLLPTVNQVSDLLEGMTQVEEGSFLDVSVLETFVRNFKPVANRLRPEDTMIAHTGFLVFSTVIPHALPVGENAWSFQKRNKRQEKYLREKEMQEREEETRTEE